MQLPYHILLKLLEPTSLCVILLLAAAAFRKRKVVNRICCWLPVAILLVCGNEWISGGMIRHLEGCYRAQDSMPQADCILVLGGGVLSRVPPRRTLEVDEAGDRILYASSLYREGKAQCVVCTGPRQAAEDMADLLVIVGVPKEKIVKEMESRNTHEHARNLLALFQQRGFKRVLLVTSAMHMPRSMGVFRRAFPSIEFIPAPTDFRVAAASGAWYRQVFAPIPTPRHLMNFSDAMHEYVGMAYYKIRGWM